eukprot:TRINITY_DN21019_c0_g1_i1.p1 TRINITY_DN21019_c0_g1~~TRINITY_DN21019_c0_g1_i1.p1  ORF type:complete len:166 (+),score=48.63 TRINITY_DN21019_c0_g1_i1:57-554(+)
MFFFFFKQKTAYEMLRSLVGSEMCIRDRSLYNARTNEIKTSITVTEWNSLIKRDAEERASSRRCYCLQHRSDAEKDSEILGTTTYDLFLKTSQPKSTTTKKARGGGDEDGEFSDEDGDNNAMGEQDNVQHRGEVDGVGEIGNINFGKSSGAVSYTHLTLPTKRIV